jgi:hypothetical protein
MDEKLADVAKKGQKGLLMLPGLAQHAAIMEEMGSCTMNGICTKVITGKRRKLEFNG